MVYNRKFLNKNSLKYHFFSNQAWVQNDCVMSDDSEGEHTNTTFIE